MQQRMTTARAATACRRSTENDALSHKIDRLLARMCDFHSRDSARHLSCAEMSDQHGTSALFLLELVDRGGCGADRRNDLGRKESPMCDFSLQSVRSRPAQVGDKLVTRDFGTGTRGFSASDDPGLAVCILPGTELAFASEVACLPAGLLGWKTKTINYKTAIFRQINKDKMAAHHDALEFPDGRNVLLTLLCEGQECTVLQLPAQPTNAEEAREQERVSYVG
jgi:hypothetical protein